MTSTSLVTAHKATEVLEAVRDMFPPDIEFTLHSAKHDGMAYGCWSITAEAGNDEQEWPQTVAESASYERAMLVKMGGVRTCPPVFPDGVFLESMTSSSLGIYPTLN